jgi:hypothetical protein
MATMWLDVVDMAGRITRPFCFRRYRFPVQGASFTIVTW